MAKVKKNPLGGADAVSTASVLKTRQLANNNPGDSFRIVKKK